MLEIEAVKSRMQTALVRLEEEFKKIRTGRATPSILEDIMVEVYGQSTPLPHVANVVTLDAQMLQITPYDPNNLDAISTAIREHKTLGLNPADDGKVVRVPIPALTAERRQQIVKQLGEKAEECRIQLRNIRHESLKEIKNQEKTGEISKDDYKSGEKKLNDAIEGLQNKVHEITKAKEKEVLTI